MKSQAQCWIRVSSDVYSVKLKSDAEELLTGGQSFLPATVHSVHEVALNVMAESYRVHNDVNVHESFLLWDEKINTFRFFSLLLRIIVIKEKIYQTVNLIA